MLLSGFLVLVESVDPVFFGFLSYSSLSCFESDDFKEGFVEKDFITFIVTRLFHIRIDDVS